MKINIENILKRIAKIEDARTPLETPWIFASVESLDMEVGIICLVSPLRERFSLDRLPDEADALWDARKMAWMQDFKREVSSAHG